MAYIWILGDSWGDTWGTYGGSEIAPDIGFEHQFERLGHRVVCLARAGMSNFTTRKNAETAMAKGAKPPTHIIQFWTEALRDLNTYKSLNQFDVNSSWQFNHLNKKITDHEMDKLTQLKTQMNNPHWALIGGQSDLSEHQIQQIKPSFILNSWRSQILKKELPKCFLVGNLDLLQDKCNNDNVETKQKILDIAQITRDEMAESPRFKDNAHPDWQCYKQLSEELVSWIDTTSHLLKF